MRRNICHRKIIIANVRSVVPSKNRSPECTIGYSPEIETVILFMVSIRGWVLDEAFLSRNSLTDRFVFPEIEPEKKTEATLFFKSFPRRFKARPAVDDDAACLLPEAVTENPSLSNSPAK